MIKIFFYGILEVQIPVYHNDINYAVVNPGSEELSPLWKCYSL